jgi:hypothetical protein
MAHPRMYDDSNSMIKRLREVCLALPQTFEKEAWGECTFSRNWRQHVRDD